MAADVVGHLRLIEWTKGANGNRLQSGLSNDTADVVHSCLLLALELAVPETGDKNLPR
jgi:hypothetical protein